jgi:putative membrane protein
MKKAVGYLFNALKGALIGTGAILPGISGGVLMIVTGVYRPLMELLSHPIKSLKKDFGFYLSVLLGFALGVLLLSKVVELLFKTSQEPATWLFIGLIVGTMPALLSESGKEGRPRSALITGIAAFALMLAFLIVINGRPSVHSTPTTLTWIICGVLWGIGFIAPGMSPSALFLFMGVYEPMAAGIADLSMPILLPMGGGLILSALLLSRLINSLLKNYYSQTMHAILGVSVASTVMILPFGSSPSFTEVLLYALMFAVGLALALWMGAMSKKLDAEKAKE